MLPLIGNASAITTVTDVITDAGFDRSVRGSLNSTRHSISATPTYLVDGDNLIGSWGGPRSGDDRRAEVVVRVAAVCARLQVSACIVFDRAPGRGAPAPPLVSVRVAGRNESADDVIRGMIDGAPAPGDLVVVTSDKPLYSYARTRGAQVLRAHEFRALERAG
jgi:predicted RNA-binding protein with PIN domain